MELKKSPTGADPAVKDSISDSPRFGKKAPRSSSLQTPASSPGKLKPLKGQPSKSDIHGGDSTATSSMMQSSSRIAMMKKVQHTIGYINAMAALKDFMTDNQKAILLAKEGKNLMDLQDYRAAVEVFCEAISLNPSVNLFNARASSYKFLDMYKEAYFDYSFMIRAEPEVGSHHCSRGLCLAKLKKFQLALEDLDRGIEIDPTPQHLYSRAMTHADCGHFGNAATDFTHALKGKEGNISNELKLKCKYRRALCFFELRKYNEAVTDCNDVLGLDANNIAAKALLARSHKQLQNFKLAEETISNAIVLDDAQAYLFIERGDIRFRTMGRNKLADSVHDFDKGIKLLEDKKSVMDSKTAEFSSGAHLMIKQTGAAVSAHAMKEVEEQLGDAYYKRSQSKMMIVADTEAFADHDKELCASIMIAALEDGLRACTLVPEDDDYYLLVANCYIKLQRFEEAERAVQVVLQRSPEQNRALFIQSYCQRAKGESRAAIEGLTKMIAVTQAKQAEIRHQMDTMDLARTTANSKHHHHHKDKEHQKDHHQEIKTYTEAQVAADLDLPLYRAFEMRGTFFHEVQAHKLALNDLGRAIALNPRLPGNYFLRGNCRMKMGYYEQAISDYTIVEGMPEFENRCALFLARGSVYRLLGQSDLALKDIKLANEILQQMRCETPEESRFLSAEKVRVLCSEAFACIDLDDYAAAWQNILNAKKINLQLLDDLKLELHRATRPEEERERKRKIIAEKRALEAATTPATWVISHEEQTRIAAQRKWSANSKNAEKEREKRIPDPPRLPIEIQGDVLYNERALFCLLYHEALARYMIGDFEDAIGTLEECLSEENSRFHPDDITVGGMYYFYGLALSRIGNLKESKEKLLLCNASHWVDNKRNSFLFNYSLAKAHQCLGENETALGLFSKALDLCGDPTNILVAKKNETDAHTSGSRGGTALMRPRSSVDRAGDKHPSSAYVCFRRAWSYKSMGKYQEAGADFEMAKALTGESDPNFAIDYRKINQFQYMIIETEPDFVERFPLLVPLAGFSGPS